MIQKIQKNQQPFTLAHNYNVPPPIARLLAARKDGYARISNLRWNQLNMPEVCKAVRKWGVKNLDVEQNRQPKIILHISGIKFNHLMVLNLSGNFIESIEALTLLNVRNLEDLNLSNNKILSLQSLRKLHTFRLRSLKLCNNPFFQIVHLVQMPLMNLEVLVLENEFKKSESFINLWKLLKIQAFHLKSLYIRNWDFNFKKIGKNGQALVRDRFFQLKPGRSI